VQDGLTDPNTWGVLAALISLMASWAALITVIRTAGRRPKLVALSMAVIAEVSAAFGVYMTVIDRDAAVFLSLRIFVASYCTFVLGLAVIQRATYRSRQLKRQSC
jgi:hypothetical protein